MELFLWCIFWSLLLLCRKASNFVLALYSTLLLKVVIGEVYLEYLKNSIILSANKDTLTSFFPIYILLFLYLILMLQLKL